MGRVGGDGENYDGKKKEMRKERGMTQEKIEIRQEQKREEGKINGRQHMMRERNMRRDSEGKCVRGQ